MSDLIRIFSAPPLFFLVVYFIGSGIGFVIKAFWYAAEKWVR